MEDVTLKELLEAGVHFGHQKRKWNPKMERFLFGEREGIYIIDLEKTVEKLREARSFLSKVAANGGTILFVGNKRQAQEAVSSEAERCGMLYVNRRWLGGTLTNFDTFRKSISKFINLLKIEEEAPKQLTKKELMVMKKERERLEKNLAGVREMKSLPGAIVVVDSHREKIAVAEANKMNIPLVAIVDTDGDPDVVEYCIPGNDDAIKSIRLLISKLADAVIDGKKEAVKVFEEKEAEKKQAGEEQVVEEKQETEKNENHS